MGGPVIPTLAPGGDVQAFVDARISDARISDARISDARISDARISDARISEMAAVISKRRRSGNARAQGKRLRRIAPGRS
jgi:hypothetical protein